MTIKSKKSQGEVEDGNETAVDPGTPPVAPADGMPPLDKKEQAKLDEYKEVTGDPSGTAKNSMEAGLIAAAEAQIKGSAVPANNAAVAAQRAREEARQAEGAKAAKAEKRPDARLKALKYPMVDPTNGVRVPMDGTPVKVPVSNWMQAQIDAVLVEVIKD